MAKLISKDDQKSKIQIVMNITEKPEDVVAIALYDAEWDTNAAVDIIMENDKEFPEWNKVGKKKPLKSPIEEKKVENKEEVLESKTISTRENTGQELPPRMRRGRNNNQDNRGRRGRRPGNERRTPNYETNSFDKMGWVRDRQNHVPKKAQRDKPRQTIEHTDSLPVPNFESSQINQQLESDVGNSDNIERWNPCNSESKVSEQARLENLGKTCPVNDCIDDNFIASMSFDRTGWARARQSHVPTNAQWDKPKKTVEQREALPVPSFETSLINQQLESDAYVVGYSGKLESWNPDHSESKASEEAQLENLVKTSPVNECIDDNLISRLKRECTVEANDSTDKLLKNFGYKLDPVEVVKNYDYLKSKNDMGTNYELLDCQNLKSKNDMGTNYELPDCQRDQSTQTNLDAALNRTRLPAPSRIPDSAVGMPGGFAPRLDIQFGNIDFSTLQRGQNKLPNNTAQSKYVGSLGSSNGLSLSTNNNPPNPGISLLQKGLIATAPSSSSSPPIRAQNPFPTINGSQSGSNITAVSSNMSQYYSPMKPNQSRPFVSSVATLPNNQRQYTGQMAQYGAWMDAQREHAPIPTEIQRDPQLQNSELGVTNPSNSPNRALNPRIGMAGQNPSAGSVVMPSSNPNTTGGYQGAVSWDPQLQAAQLAAVTAPNPAAAQQYYAQNQYYAYLYSPQYLQQIQQAAAHQQSTLGYGQGGNSNHGGQLSYPGGYGTPQSH